MSNNIENDDELDYEPEKQVSIDEPEEQVNIERQNDPDGPNAGTGKTDGDGLKVYQETYVEGLKQVIQDLSVQLKRKPRRRTPAEMEALDVVETRRALLRAIKAHAKQPRNQIDGRMLNFVNAYNALRDEDPGPVKFEEPNHKDD